MPPGQAASIAADALPLFEAEAKGEAAGGGRAQG